MVDSIMVSDGGVPDSARKAHPLVADAAWRRFGDFRHVGSAKILDLAQRADRILRRLDVPCPPGNRFSRAIQLLRRAHEGKFDLTSREQLLMQHLSEAQRLAVEMYIITTQLHSSLKPPFREKLKQILSGGDLPEQGDEDALPWSSQFELYVHALFNIAGVRTDLREPPDLIFNFGDEVVGIAAKRVWNPNQLKKHLSQGAKQIAAAQLRGIVAVNVDTYVSDVALPHPLEAKGKEFNESINRLHGHLPYLARKEHVLGLLGIGTNFSWEFTSGEKPRAGMSAFTQMILWGDDAAEEAFAHKFFQGFEARIKRWLLSNL